MCPSFKFKEHKIKSKIDNFIEDLLNKENITCEEFWTLYKIYEECLLEEKQEKNKSYIETITKLFN